MTTTTPTRDDLRKTYMLVVKNWALTTADVADALKIETKDALARLRRIERTGLLESTHVNGERELTWQSHYDIENDDRANAVRDAGRDFNAQFPKGEEIKTGSGRGGFGPRYTDEQIIKGHEFAVAKARAGEKVTHREVAEHAGVKSPNYFAKIRRERGAKLLRASKKAAK